MVSKLRTLYSEPRSDCILTDASEKQYRTRFKKWGFKKNDNQRASRSSDIPSVENDRRRTAQALSVRTRHVAFILQVSRYRPAPEFRWHSYDEKELWRIHIATDNIVRGSFGCARWNWTAESFSYSSPSIGQGISRRWQYLDSLCSAIIDLSAAGVPSYINGSLQVLVSEIVGIACTVERQCFMIQLIWIWKICLNLSKIRLSDISRGPG